jgi:hypothetical protein
MITMVSAVRAQEKRIGVKDLPKAVSSAFQKTYPKAVILGTATEVEHGKTMYEIESTDGDIHRDLLYTKNGEVYEIEERVTPEALPPDVKVVIDKKLKSYTWIKGEKITRGATVQYDLRLRSSKKTLSVVMDGNGKILSSTVVKEKKENKEKEEHEEKED